MAKETIDAILSAEKAVGEAEALAKSKAAEMIADAKQKAAEIVSEKESSANSKAAKIISDSKQKAEKVLNEAKEDTKGIDELLKSANEHSAEATDAVIERVIGIC